MIGIGLILLLIQVVWTQNDTLLPLNRPFSATLLKDQQAYFMVRVPADEVAGKNHLIFDLSYAGDEFSDPDIMISSVSF